MVLSPACSSLRQRRYCPSGDGQADGCHPFLVHVSEAAQRAMARMCLASTHLILVSQPRSMAPYNKA
jgi:hypothetical protein